MTPLPLSDDDLGDDAEPDERIKSPSLIPTNIYTKKREGRMGFGARRVTAQGIPFGGAVGLGLGLSSHYSLSGDATISRPENSPILPEQPRLVALHLADCPSPILLPPPFVSVTKRPFPDETVAELESHILHLRYRQLSRNRQFSC